MENYHHWSKDQEAIASIGKITKFTSIMKYVIVNTITGIASIISLSVDIRPFEQSRLSHIYQELRDRVKIM